MRRRQSPPHNAPHQSQPHHTGVPPSCPPVFLCATVAAPDVYPASPTGFSHPTTRPRYPTDDPGDFREGLLAFPSAGPHVSEGTPRRHFGLFSPQPPSHEVGLRRMDPWWGHPSYWGKPKRKPPAQPPKHPGGIGGPYPLTEVRQADYPAWASPVRSFRPLGPRDRQGPPRPVLLYFPIPQLENPWSEPSSRSSSQPVSPRISPEWDPRAPLEWDYRDVVSLDPTDTPSGTFLPPLPHPLGSGEVVSWGPSDGGTGEE